MNLAEIRKKALKPQDAVPVNQSQPLSFTEMLAPVTREAQTVAEPVSVEPSFHQETVADSIPMQEESLGLTETLEKQDEKQEQLAAAEPVVMPELQMVDPVTVPEAIHQTPRPAASSEYDPLAVLLAGRDSVLVEMDDALSAQEGASEVASEEMAEYLCFRVSDEHYAVNIMEIKEIIKPRETTEVPRAPDYVAGVLSLRGVIIPIFDMRKRLGLPDMAATSKQRIIVVKKEEGVCGILVDEVVQVARIPLSGIESAPPVLDGIDRDFVSGIGRCEGTMLILLSMEHILDLTLA